MIQRAILVTLLLSILGAQAFAAEASIREHNGRPVIFVDGAPQFPMLYALTEGGRLTWEATPAENLRLFAKMGFRLFQIDVWFRDIWRVDGTLDMDTVSRQLQGVLAACPEARIFIRLHVDAPAWWIQANQAERVEYGDGPVSETPVDDIERGMRNSFASEKWRNEAGDKLREFESALSIRPEGASVIGLHLSGGVYGEWHYWGFGHAPDTGPAMTTRFRAWLREKYQTDANLRSAWKNPTITLDTATVPDGPSRAATRAGVFRNPDEERNIIDYGQCHQTVVADTVLYFCRTAKQAWPHPLVTGAFFGYYFYMYLMVPGGHLELERVLNSPDIDYLSGPFSYELWSRELGGTGQFRGLLESCRLHGKLWLNEMDHPTMEGDVFGRSDPFRQKNAPDCIAVMRRNTALAVTSGQGMWWYDFGAKGNGGWWNHAELIPEVEKHKAWTDKILNTPYKPLADVLFVFDTHVYYHLGLHGPQGDTLTGDIVNLTTTDAFHSGCVFDCILLSDLPKADLTRYKAVVFANTFLMTEDQRRFIREKVATGNRTLIHIYAPGYADGATLSTEHVREVTGMNIVETPMPKPPRVALTEPGPAGEPCMEIPAPTSPMFAVEDASAEKLGVFEGTEQVAFARKKFDAYTAVYSALPLRGPSVLRKLFRDAGAHVYADSGDMVTAGGNVICLHTLEGGQRSLRLPDGTTREVSLPRRSTTLFDATTGAPIEWSLP